MDVERLFCFCEEMSDAAGEPAPVLHRLRIDGLTLMVDADWAGPCEDFDSTDLLARATVAHIQQVLQRDPKILGAELTLSHASSCELITEPMAVATTPLKKP